MLVGPARRDAVALPSDGPDHVLVGRVACPTEFRSRSASGRSPGPHPAVARAFLPAFGGQQARPRTSTGSSRTADVRFTNFCSSRCPKRLAPGDPSTRAQDRQARLQEMVDTRYTWKVRPGRTCSRACLPCACRRDKAWPQPHHRPAGSGVNLSLVPPRRERRLQLPR